MNIPRSLLLRPDEIVKHHGYWLYLDDFDTVWGIERTGYRDSPLVIVILQKNYSRSHE